MAGGMHCTQSIATLIGGWRGKHEGVTLDLVFYIYNGQVHCGTWHNPLGSDCSPVSLRWDIILIQKPQLPGKLCSDESARSIPCHQPSTHI